MVRESPGAVGSFTLVGSPSVRGQWVAAGILESCDRNTLKPGGIAEAGFSGHTSKAGAGKIVKQELSKVKSKSSTIEVFYKSLHIILSPKLESMVFLGEKINSSSTT